MDEDDRLDDVADATVSASFTAVIKHELPDPSFSVDAKH